MTQDEDKLVNHERVTGAFIGASAGFFVGIILGCLLTTKAPARVLMPPLDVTRLNTPSDCPPCEPRRPGADP